LEPTRVNGTTCKFEFVCIFDSHSSQELRTNGQRNKLTVYSDKDNIDNGSPCKKSLKRAMSMTVEEWLQSFRKAEFTKNALQ
jgi:hypothetical protein